MTVNPDSLEFCIERLRHMAFELNSCLPDLVADRIAAIVASHEPDAWAMIDSAGRTHAVYTTDQSKFGAVPCYANPHPSAHAGERIVSRPPSPKARLTSKEEVRAVYPQSFADHVGLNYTYIRSNRFAYSESIGMGDDEAEAWADAASKLPEKT